MLVISIFTTDFNLNNAEKRFIARIRLKYMGVWC